MSTTACALHRAQSQCTYIYICIEYFVELARYFTVGAFQRRHRASLCRSPAILYFGHTKQFLSLAETLFAFLRPRPHARACCHSRSMRRLEQSHLLWTQAEATSGRHNVHPPYQWLHLVRGTWLGWYAEVSDNDRREPTSKPRPAYENRSSVQPVMHRSCSAIGFGVCVGVCVGDIIAVGPGTSSSAS